MIPSGTPILILKEGTKREKGKGAQFSNIAAAKAIADAVRSTLGPKGMDKMLVDSMGDVVITNDGVTILKEVEVEHPAAKMLVEVAKTQDQECGDGTTTAAVLTGELLKHAEGLIELNIHPTIITSGYRMAMEKAAEILEKGAEDIKPSDAETLNKIARTAMESKSVRGSSTLLADIAVKAVLAVKEERDGKTFVDEGNIQIVKRHGGSIGSSEFIEGIIVDKEPAHGGMPKKVANAKVALVNRAFEIKKPEIDTKIEINDPTMVQKFLSQEEDVLRGYAESLKKVGANVLFCQKGIDDLALYHLAKAGIYAVKQVGEKDMGKLAKATGAKIVIRIGELSADDLGKAGSVEKKKVGENTMTFVTNCPGAKAVSILLRGGTEHVVDEAERSLDDAISVVAVAVEDGKMVTGGGAAPMEVAMLLREYASTVGGREQMAIEAFADAMEIIPRTLAENTGLDPINMLVELRKSHKEGNPNHGLNLQNGKVEDMRKNSILEPLRVLRQAINSATDASVMILRIDDVIASKGPGAGKGPKGGGGGGMPSFD